MPDPDSKSQALNSIDKTEIFGKEYANYYASNQARLPTSANRQRTFKNHPIMFVRSSAVHWNYITI